MLAYLNKHWIAKKIDEARKYLHASSAAHTPKQIGQVRWCVCECVYACVSK